MGTRRRHQPAVAPDAAAWVVAQVPRGRRLVRADRLTGGITSEMSSVTVEDAAGRLHRLVLRRWTGDPWPDGAVDDGRVLVPREAAVLTALEPTGVPAPHVVATDPNGDGAGLPALLMTRLPGRLDLSPADPDEWTRQLAEGLASVHDLAVRPEVSAYEPWLDLDGVQVPDRAPWTEAVAVLRDRPSAAAEAFVHHDFQQFNVLWDSRGGLSGIVDWVWAGAGPPDADVAHCRLNLCLLYGADRAIAFQSAYEAASGRRVHPWWDVAGIVDGLGWDPRELQRQAGRRRSVPPGEVMRRELEALLRHVLVRVR